MITGHTYGQLTMLQSFGVKLGTDNYFQIGLQINPTSPDTYDFLIWTNGKCTIYYVEPNFINFDQTAIQESQINFIDFGNALAQNGASTSSVSILEKIDNGFCIGSFLINMNIGAGELDFTINLEDPY